MGNIFCKKWFLFQVETKKKDRSNCTQTVDNMYPLINYLLFMYQILLGYRATRSRKNVLFKKCIIKPGCFDNFESHTIKERTDLLNFSILPSAQATPGFDFTTSG